MAKFSKTTTSDLDAHTGYWMRLVSNTVSQSFARKLEDSGVTVAEWVVLRKMYSENSATAPSVVSEALGLSRGAVSKLLTRLIEKQLVHRAESASDRRYQEVQLTKKAQKMIPHLAALADENDASFFSGLTHNEHRQLLRLLKKLAQHHQIKTSPLD